MKKLLPIFILIAMAACTPKAEKLKSPLGDEIAKKVNTPTSQPVENATTPKKEKQEKAEKKPAFDHRTYAGLLEKYAKYPDGRVDYKGLLKEKPLLDTYIKTIAEADLSALGPNDTKALLINAYNANTLSLILNHYGKIKSIRDIDKPWDAVAYTLAGDKVSLNNIEHNLLRAVFKDPRIHFAVNCASIGCPPLPNFAFEGDTLDTQLDKVITDAFANPRYVKIEGKKLVLSSLLKWYGEDFTKKDWNPRADTLPEFVAKYASGDVKVFLEKNPNPKVKFQDYDWNLNDIE